jgi:hypothetical protein
VLNENRVAVWPFLRARDDANARLESENDIPPRFLNQSELNDHIFYDSLIVLNRNSIDTHTKLIGFDVEMQARLTNLTVISNHTCHMTSQRSRFRNSIWLQNAVIGQSKNWVFESWRYLDIMVFSRSKATLDQHQCGLTHLSFRRSAKSFIPNLFLSVTKYCLLKQQFQVNSLLLCLKCSRVLGSNSSISCDCPVICFQEASGCKAYLVQQPGQTNIWTASKKKKILPRSSLPCQVCKHSCADLRILGPRAPSLDHHYHSDVSIGEMR